MSGRKGKGLPSRATRRAASAKLLPSRAAVMRMTSLIRGVLQVTQRRILEAVDLTQIAAPTPGELSRTLETWAQVLRADARNRLSLDFDMVRIKALQDLQGGTPVDRRYGGGFATREAAERAAVLNLETRRHPSLPQSTWEVREVGGKRPFAIFITGKKEKTIGESLDKIAADVATVNAKGITSLTGINVRAASGLGARVDMFRETNLSFIRSLVDGQITDIQTMLESAESTGLRVEELRAQIQERFEVSKSKADLLARDQTLKLNAAITQARQRGAGVEKYVWTTSGDERVREEHAALEGQVVSWDNPPDVGHPGEDIQCRCTAFPVIEEFDDGTGLDLGFSGPGLVNSFGDDEG